MVGAVLVGAVLVGEGAVPVGAVLVGEGAVPVGAEGAAPGRPASYRRRTRNAPGFRPSPS